MWQVPIVPPVVRHDKSTEKAAREEKYEKKWNVKKHNENLQTIFQSLEIWNERTKKTEGDWNPKEVQVTNHIPRLEHFQTFKKSQHSNELGLFCYSKTSRVNNEEFICNSISY